MADRKRNRLTWVTNFSAPYRHPVWATLAADYDLTLILMGDRATESGRVRDRAWFSATSTSYTYHGASARQLVFRGCELPVAHRSQTQVVARSDALVLGGWEAPAYWQMLAAAKRNGVPTVGFYESTLDSQRYPTGPVAATRRLFFKSLDAIVTPGEAASRAVRAMGVDEARIHTGFNAIDVRRFNIESRDAREARPGETDRPGHRYIYVGQLIDRKNVDGLLRSFNQIAHNEDSLTIVGEGDAHPNLKDLSTRLPRSAQVSWVSSVSYEAMPSILATHHTLVLPSHEEVWGLVVNEALAAGLQCVVSDRCGVTESVEAMPGVFIYEADTGLTDALAQARWQWIGWVDSPEILARTPERFAATFAGAIEAARGGRGQ